VEDHSNAHAILVVEEDDMRGGRTASVRAGLGQIEKEEKREMGRRWKEGMGQGERWHGSRALGFGFIFKNSFSFLFKTVLQTRIQTLF
jgi:hypothetical protein